MPSTIFKHCRNIIIMITKEIWKDIKGYEGFYMVSSLGRVKSLERIDSAGRLRKTKILKLSISRGYKMVKLYINSTKKTIHVHQLVAIAFLNHVPCGHKSVINHIDINPSNNRLDNLEIITQRENANLKHIKSSSKYVGVSWHKAAKKWSAYINTGNHRTYLGLFKVELEASQAYQKALNAL